MSRSSARTSQRKRCRAATNEVALAIQNEVALAIQLDGPANEDDGTSANEDDGTSANERGRSVELTVVRTTLNESLDDESKAIYSFIVNHGQKLSRNQKDELIKVYFRETTALSVTTFRTLASRGGSDELDFGSYTLCEACGTDHEGNQSTCSVCNASRMRHYLMRDVRTILKILCRTASSVDTLSSTIGKGEGERDDFWTSPYSEYLERKGWELDGKPLSAFALGFDGVEPLSSLWARKSSEDYTFGCIQPLSMCPKERYSSSHTFLLISSMRTEAGGRRVKAPIPSDIFFKYVERFSKGFNRTYKVALDHRQDNEEILITPKVVVIDGDTPMMAKAANIKGHMAKFSCWFCTACKQEGQRKPFNVGKYWHPQSPNTQVAACDVGRIVDDVEASQLKNEVGVFTIDDIQNGDLGENHPLKEDSYELMRLFNIDRIASIRIPMAHKLIAGLGKKALQMVFPTMHGKNLNQTQMEYVVQSKKVRNQIALKARMCPSGRYCSTSPDPFFLKEVQSGIANRTISDTKHIYLTFLPILIDHEQVPELAKDLLHTVRDLILFGLTSSHYDIDKFHDAGRNLLSLLLHNKALNDGMHFHNLHVITEHAREQARRSGSLWSSQELWIERQAKSDTEIVKGGNHNRSEVYKTVAKGIARRDAAHFYHSPISSEPASKKSRQVHHQSETIPVKGEEYSPQDPSTISEVLAMKLDGAQINEVLRLGELEIKGKMFGTEMFSTSASKVDKTSADLNKSCFGVVLDAFEVALASGEISNVIIFKHEELQQRQMNVRRGGRITGDTPEPLRGTLGYIREGQEKVKVLKVEDILSFDPVLFVEDEQARLTNVLPCYESAGKD